MIAVICAMTLEAEALKAKLDNVEENVILNEQARNTNGFKLLG